MFDININTFFEKVDHVGRDKALAQAILIVMGTSKRSRVGRPKFGCYIHKFLFNPFDRETAAIIRLDISDALEDENNDLYQRIKKYDVTVLLDKKTSSFWVSIKYETQYSRSEKLEFNLTRNLI